MGSQERKGGEERIEHGVGEEMREYGRAPIGNT
jgi:hypothetical protein